MGDNKESIIGSLKENINQYNVEKVEYIYMLNYNKIYLEEFEEFNQIFTEVISDIAIDRNTNLKFSERWFNTIIHNFKYIVESNKVNDYKRKYNNVPAIIVSAGPSLSKNIKELEYVKSNLFILTGGRTLKPLLDKEIYPNLVSVVDPVQESYDLVKGYIDKVKCPLLYYEGTNEKVVEDHKGDKIIFTQNNLIYKLFNEDIDNLGLGGSVAHTLTGMAVLMGCNPIIFIGQDLAYTDEKYHADIAVNQFKSLDENVSKDTDYIYVDDINGNKVRTSLVLDGFRRELEKIIKDNANITFINATEGGSRIDGTIDMSLKEAIEKYRLHEEVISIKPYIKHKTQEIKNEGIRILRESIEADEFIISKCNLGLEETKKLKRNIKFNLTSKIKQSISKLDKIDEEIRIKYKNLELLSSLIYPVVYDILNKPSSKEDYAIIEKSIELYSSILEVGKFALDFMKQALDDLKIREDIN
ncbi:motility associated factor glycosyltransferase family protein [Clostridium botulinum]|nr:6-hydroxymethylpterin diphosphokinase MptE-like protein [Clostridium botulinum]